MINDQLKFIQCDEFKAKIIHVKKSVLEEPTTTTE